MSICVDAKNLIFERKFEEASRLFSAAVDCYEETNLPQGGPLIVDLMRLPFKYPGATQSVLSETLRQFVQTFDVSPEDVGHQFTAYVADRISMDPKREHLFLKAWRQGIQAVSA